MAEVSRVLVVAHVTTVGGNVRDEVANTYLRYEIENDGLIFHNSCLSGCRTCQKLLTSRSLGH